MLNIVSGVTKLSNMPTSSTQERQAENIRKMFLAMADDIRVILIKLADRLHNMRTLRFHSPERRRAIAQETLDIYVSIAARLGIYWIKTELEENAFKYINPEEYARIENLVAKSRAEREQYIGTVRDTLRKKMEAAGLKAEVLGRSKNYFSIHSKMQAQSLTFEQIYDLIAFRIILDTVSQCYEALGLIHSLWKPIDHKFKDYIGRPKPNMYQSLHTTVIGPVGERIEIQIRTWEMDRVAKSGIAAHWSYKEGHRIDENISKKFAWIQDLVDNQESFRDPGEFLENVRIDLFPDEVYVFTPKGDIRALPKGATPVDFAYLIHTEVGQKCVGAKVNGQMVSLPYELRTGDIVEIVTAKNHTPSKDWLKFVKTIKARSKIRQWIKAQEKERSISLGREMLEKAFPQGEAEFHHAVQNGPDERGGGIAGGEDSRRSGCQRGLREGDTPAGAAAVHGQAPGGGKPGVVAGKTDQPGPQKETAGRRSRQGGGGHPHQVRQVLPAGAGGCDHRLHHARLRCHGPPRELCERLAHEPGTADRGRMEHRVRRQVSGEDSDSVLRPGGVTGRRGEQHQQVRRQYPERQLRNQRNPNGRKLFHHQRRGQGAPRKNPLRRQEGKARAGCATGGVTRFKGAF